jgi:hypothetical protein
MSLLLRLGLALIFALVAIGASPARALAQTNKQRDEARKIGGEALDLYKAGDFRAALAKFEQADKIVPAPTLKLHVARCLDRLDRMREAADKYRDVIVIELKPSSPKPYIQARDDAVKELAQLLPQIPRLTVIVTGPGSASAQVTLDGKPMASTAVGEEQPIDPGFYRLEATVAERAAQKSVRMDRGKTEKVELKLLGDVAVDLRSGAPAVDTRPFRIAGWTFVGVGGAGLLMGAVAGGLVLKDSSALSEVCPDRKCAPDQQAAVDKLNTERAISSAGFIAGLVSGAVGGGLLAYATLAGRPPIPTVGAAARANPRWMPIVGVNTAGICGTF